MNTGNTENYCRTLINGGGRLRHAVHLVMMIVDGLRLFRRPVTSTTITTTTVTVFAHSVLQTVRVGMKPKSEKIQKGNRPPS